MPAIDKNRNINHLFDELSKNISGEIRFDPVTLSVYSVDASIFEIPPIGVVIPKTIDDIIQTVLIAQKHNVPLIPRGAGTGIVGGCIGKGLIIDTSKYLNRIIEIDYENEYAIVEPGVVQDTLNEALGKQGYRLGPNTSTGNRATLGGMVANNSAGSHSLLFGRMVDHVLELEMVLASGELMHFSEEQGHGPIYQTIDKIRKEYKDDIEKHFPKIPRRVSGYNLDELIKDQPLNLCKVITGSEGSLGIVTRIKVRICKKTRFSGICVLHFDDMIEGMRSIDRILAHHPIAVEMMDNRIIEMGKLSPQLKSKLGWLRGNPEAIFAVELEGESLNEVKNKLDWLEKEHISSTQVILTDPLEISHIWEVRKSGLGLLLSKRSYNRAIAFIEDITIHPHHLASFMVEFRAYLKSIGKDAGIYGHVGSGAMHLRPYLDLRNEGEVKLMEKMMNDVADLLLKYGGSLSGEHGDGLLRSWQNKKLFGDRVYEAFVMLKQAFDPNNLMNPGKVVGDHPVHEDLRLNPKTKLNEIPTFLDFSKEGGFTLSADLCNGNGSCRKTTGVMCPSFQASHDEYDTTRARAQTLRSIIHGTLPMDDLTGDALNDVLDLCIECKGCKKECPSQVDMAKMKSEILYQTQEKHGYSLRNRIISSLGTMNYLNSFFPSFYNTLIGLKFTKKVLSYFGISEERNLPLLSKHRFSKIHQNQSEGKQVVLFSDTYTEFHYPEIGHSASSVLQKLGYSVIVPSWECCGRPLISKGFLKQAKLRAEKLIDSLNEYAMKETPIIVLEPSCLSAIQDDYQGLLGYKHEKLQRVIKACISFDEFVDGRLPQSAQPDSIKVQLHGHCHQKALIGTEPTQRVLKALGCKVAEIPSGCCGMAGSFGYEKEHYDFSMKIGELQLFPAIRTGREVTWIIANGVSCRTQIHDGTGSKAHHLAEVVDKIM